MELDPSDGYTCHFALPYDPTMFILLTLKIYIPQSNKLIVENDKHHSNSHNRKPLQCGPWETMA